MNEKSENIEKDTKLKFFNEAVEYINKFDILGSTNIDDSIIAKSGTLVNTDSLRDEMLTELDYLKDLIINNPDIKLSKLSKKEKELYNKFVKYFSYCPVCDSDNHYYNLKHMYFDDKLTFLKKKLIALMHNKNKKILKYNVIFGIPCCNCYKKFFE
ncbi:MAG: hypothetical protein KGD63_00865 [Candidatus Lokiarchaeota archaeon]|nr:hypothetical protein [Candidatus Lokiarchaeota archaeon]